MAIVADHLFELIAKQFDERGPVVRYEPVQS
jgi:hypothetical protein